MLQHVLTPDIGDEGDLGLDRSHIREVLFGSHTQVHAARFHSFFQGGNDGLKFEFVRHELETKRATALRKIRHHAPKRVVADFPGKGVGGYERCGAEQQHAHQSDQPKANPQNSAAIGNPHDSTSKMTSLVLTGNLRRKYAHIHSEWLPKIYSRAELEGRERI